jgi:hypothetical protein
VSRASRTARRHRADTEAARATREVARRAVRRLDMLEWVILFGAAVLSAGAGALVALLGAHSLGLPFRLTWTVASLLLFGVPGWFAVRRAKREDEAFREKILREIGGSDV